MGKREDIIKLAKEGLLEESIEDLYNNAPCGYFSTLPDGTFIKINNTFLNWLGYEAPDLLYVRKLQDLLNIGDIIFYETHFSPLLQMQGFANEINFYLRKANGEQLPVLLNTVLVQNKERKPLFFRTTVFNITDRKKYEVELLNAKKRAEEASRVKSEFLSTVSHEIRTPLSAITGIINLLHESDPSPKQMEYLSILKQSSESLLRLINDILDLGKIESGKTELNESSFNIRELIDGVLFSQKVKAKEKGLSVTAAIDERIPEFLFGDAVKIGQVLTNLIGNAIKFTETGFVAVRLKLKEQLQEHYALDFEVTDTGIGISADKTEAIFEEFSQANAAIYKQFGGTGLGLAITRKLLALYGSEIDVVSELGKGSSFSFTLTLKRGEAISNETTSAMHPKAVEGIRVLVAEDSKANVYVISQYLKKWGARFDIASSGLEAVQLVTENEYDLVLMDLHMPILGGLDASKSIRSLEGEKYKNLPIIALTASAEIGTEAKAREFGMNGFMLKPFEPDTLYALLSSYGSVPNAMATVVEEQLAGGEDGEIFNLATFYELMEGDKEAMVELLSIIIKDFNEASAEIDTALRQQDAKKFRFWQHRVETSLELLHARKLQTALEHAKMLLLEDVPDAEELHASGRSMQNQFVELLSGLEKAHRQLL